MCAVGSHPPPCGVVGPGPLSRRLATPDTTLSVLQPVWHLGTLREAIDMTPLDLGLDQDMILG